MSIHEAPTWQITDEALAVLDAHLAVPAAERGAALLVAAHTRLVVGVVPDPVAGEATSYWHSDRLNRRLNDTLLANPGLRYGGTAHSHPHQMAWPSGPDHVAFRTTMNAMAGQREAIFPIVVQSRVAELRMPRALGGEHLVPMAHGTLAPYTGHPVGDGMQVTPCRLRVVPLRASIDGALELLGDHARLTAGPTQVVAGSGTAWLVVPLTGEDSRLDLAFPQSYPELPPLVRADGERFAVPEWDTTLPVGERLAGALRAAMHAPAEVRAGIEARLGHHLPARAPWRVAVVGCGSVGSNVAEQLVRSGISDLTLIDPDHVGPENLSRSVYAAADIGRPKPAALAARLRSIAPDVRIAQWHGEVTAVDPTALTSADLVVLAADDSASEAWLAHLLYDAGVPHISAKLFARADAGELVVVVPDRRTACTRCATGASGTAGGRSGAVDYGSGRLVGELALGPDIVAVCARAAKAVLAVLARDTDGPLASWIGPLLEAQRTLHLGASVDGWGVFAQCAQPPMDGPFASLWVRTASRPDCGVCGPERVAPGSPLTALAVSPELDELLDAELAAAARDR